MAAIPSTLPSETPTLQGTDEFEPTTRHDTVDVAQAEREFNDLARQLSRESHPARSRSRSRSVAVRRKWRRRKSTQRDRDVEKLGDVDDGFPTDDEPFDLRAYLTSSNDKHQAAGIKHKHVGVTWEDLQVDVFGGMDHRVSLPPFELSNCTLMLPCTTVALHQDLWT